MVHRRAGFGFAVAAVGAGFAANAWATPTSKLTYVRGEGTEQCPGEDVLRSAVAARLGYDPFFPWAKRTVVVQLDKAPHGYRGRAQILEEGGPVLGERSLTSPSSDCAELVKSLALAISIAIDDLESAAPHPGPPSAVDPSADAPAPTLPASPEPIGGETPKEPPQEKAVDSTRPRRLQAALWLGALGSLGDAPSPNVGAALAAGIRGGGWSLSLEGRADLPATMNLTDGGKVSSSLLLASVVPCLHWRGPFACLMGTIGNFHASASNIAAPRDDSALYLGTGVRVGFELPLSAPFYLRGHLDGLATFTPNRLELNGQTLYSLPVFSGGLGVDVGARFP
jgi:hypothetical protein